MQDLEKEFKERFLELRKIINTYDLILHAPSDEFDTLNHKILSHLYKGANFEKIKNILDSDICTYYGLYINEFDSDEIALEIIQWWNK